MSNNRKKVLIVDDNVASLMMARNILMSKYDAFTVPSAKDMYQFLEKKIPDLILLDVLMPGISGYKALKHLKSDSRLRNIPVIFLTSQVDAESEIEGLSLGAADYVTKPFAPHLLLKRIEMHLLMEEQRVALEHINSNLQQLVDEATDTVIDLQKAIIITLSDLVEYRDRAEGEHAERNAYIMKLLIEEAKRCNVYIDEIHTWEMSQLLQSSQIHDVGKIFIRDNILLKPDKLTYDEFEEVKKHTLMGEDIIEKISKKTKEENEFLNHAKLVVGAHHERWDGSGYPRGLMGRAIPLEGRIMALVDVYDALVSKRPYKEPYSHEEAITIIMEGFGTQFDPAFTEAFMAASERFTAIPER
ncbi:MAG: response regulator [Clostridiales bacterium]|jgi:putative two-component system response regulator|nr:response regulator [Clostridiales bacterium]